MKLMLYVNGHSATERLLERKQNQLGQTIMAAYWRCNIIARAANCLLVVAYLSFAALAPSILPLLLLLLLPLLLLALPLSLVSADAATPTSQPTVILSNSIRLVLSAERQTNCWRRISVAAHDRWKAPQRLLPVQIESRLAFAELQFSEKAPIGGFRAPSSELSSFKLHSSSFEMSQERERDGCLGEA